MSRTLARLTGTGTGGQFAEDDAFTLVDGQVLKDQVDLLIAGAVQRNVLVAGDDVTGLDASASGDVLLLHSYPPIEIPNESGQLSGFTDANGAVFAARFRFALRVSNGAISITPKLKYGTTISGITNVAMISGDAACSATADDYTGTDQIQDVLVTLPSGLKLWKAFVTVGGMPAAGYQAWASVRFCGYVQLP